MPGQDETREPAHPSGQVHEAAIPDQASARDSDTAYDETYDRDRDPAYEETYDRDRDAAYDQTHDRDRDAAYDQTHDRGRDAAYDQSSGRDEERRTPASGRVPEHDGPMTDHDGRSLGQLVASASRDLSALVRGEIALAKAELTESVRAAAKGAGLFGAAGFLAYVAFLMLSIAAGFGLMAAGLHPAVSFLIVAGVYLLVAMIISYVGLRSVRKAKAPERTLHSIEEAKGMVGRGNASGGASGGAGPDHRPR
ncbi:MAG: phage holin family protein [Actinopolymorphaceae bacterium]